ncbi:YadA-like family protein [Variovorax sp. H27-G14]
MSTTNSSLSSLSTSVIGATTGYNSLSTGLSTVSSNVGDVTSTVNNINNNGTKYFHANSTLPDATATGQAAVAIGPQSLASGANSFAAGTGAQATADGAVAVGFGAQATGTNAIAIGSGALATGSQAIGANARAGGGGVALGDNADAGGTPLSKASGVSQGTAIGFGAVVQQTGGVALGANAVASTAAGVASYVPTSATPQQAASIRATNSTQAAVSVGDPASGQFRQITGVAGGTADSDAANISQLKATANAVVAGGVQYATNPDGSINYNQVTLGNGQAPNGTRLSNVAPGVLPNDAATVGQVQGIQSQLQGQIGDLARIAYSGVAMATAMSSLPQSMTPGKSLMSVGVGYYSGYSALAIGFSQRSDDGKWVYKINAGMSAQRFNVGLGVGYEF